MRYYNVVIFPTLQCNQTCYYCHNYKSYLQKIYFDLDYFNEILNIYKENNIQNMSIEISGGEPGLIENFLDIISFLENKEFVKQVILLSNGLIRKKYDIEKIYNILKTTSFIYEEHTALDLNNKEIEYFYSDIKYTSNKLINHLIILTPKTMDSLINNFDFYFENILSKYNISLRLYTPKFEKDFNNYDNYINDIYKLNTLLSDKNYKTIDISLYKKNDLYQYCAKVSPYHYINFQNNTIGLCSMQVNTSTEYLVNKENIKKVVNMRLFKANEYCKKCLRSFDMKNIFLDNLKNKNFYNMVEDKPDD